MQQPRQQSGPPGVGSLLLSSVAIMIGFLVTQPGSLLSLPHPCLLPVEEIAADKLAHPSALEGKYEPNTALKSATKLFEGQVKGSETVAFAPDGSLVLLERTGSVLRAESKGEGKFGLPAEVAFTGGGRPLGGHYDSAGNLIVCVAPLGLVKVAAESHEVVVLTSKVSADSPMAAGSRIVYANDLDIGKDGTVYFSDSSSIPPALNQLDYWDTFRSYFLTQLQGSSTGRLLTYSAATGKTHVLAAGFFYANGVALAADESFVAVVETPSMKVYRYWLQGPKKGTVDVLIEGLPGHPDGISRSSDGNFWVAILAPPVKALSWAAPYKLGRWVLAWLPDDWRPKVPTWGLVVKVSPQGDVLQTLMDRDGSNVAHISSVTEHAGKLFFGNLVGDYVSFTKAPADSL